MRILLLLWLLLGCLSLSAIETKNRFSSYADLGEDVQYLGLDWALELYGSRDFGGLDFSGEYSLYSRYQSKWEEGHAAILDLKSYRYYLNAADTQSQLRIGMQHISFGPAKALRPLMWFDRVDPLDPYQVTEGVEAALFRHHWLNGANLWLWGVLGSADTKGNEIVGGKKNKPELGGRIQYPSPIGDAALSFHSRDSALGREYRLGADLRMDYALGWWLEGSASRFEGIPGALSLSALGSIGADYVLSVGNGLAITAESMILAISEEDMHSIRYEELSAAVILDYPIGLLDSLRFLGSYALEAETGSIQGAWRRTYDYLALDLGVNHSKPKGGSVNIMISVIY
jgi:hypothetical protein